MENTRRSRKRSSPSKSTRRRCSANWPATGRTCYDAAALNTLSALWNKANPNREIVSTDETDIWDELVGKISSCGDEMCWLSQPFVKGKLNISDFFADFAPKSWDKENVWLDSIQIGRFMRRCQKKFSYFKFIGPSAIDFDTLLSKDKCVENSLCKFNLKKYIKSKITDVGAILNTDTHDLDGTHWIAFHMSISSKGINMFFFDSTGSDIPLQIKTFIERVREQADLLKIEVDVDSNRGNAHQKTTTECGMYCMYFLWAIITRQRKPSDFKTIVIPDDEMIEYRSLFFNRK